MYILWNYEQNSPIIASEDKGLLEELMCDTYFDDAYYDFCWKALSPLMNPISVEELPEYARTTYQDVSAWYNAYMDIVRVEVVE